jgi:valyl-tRNA synthetase
MEEGSDRAFYTVDILVSVLDTCLRLLHPFTPFLTEELWGFLRSACLEHGGKIGLEDVADSAWPEALIVAPWPEPLPDEGWDDQAIKDFETIQEIVRAVRNARAEKNVKPNQKIPATVVAGEFATTLEREAIALANLGRIDPEQLSIYNELVDKPENSIVLVVGSIEIYLPLAGMVDAAEERARLEKDLVEAENQIARLEKLLNSPFAEKAPSNVVQGERDRLADFQETVSKLKKQLKSQS